MILAVFFFTSFLLDNLLFLCGLPFLLFQVFLGIFFSCLLFTIILLSIKGILLLQITEEFEEVPVQSRGFGILDVGYRSTVTFYCNHSDFILLSCTAVLLN